MPSAPRKRTSHAGCGREDTQPSLETVRRIPARRWQASNFLPITVVSAGRPGARLHLSRPHPFGTRRPRRRRGARAPPPAGGGRTAASLAARPAQAVATSGSRRLLPVMRLGASTEVHVLEWRMAWLVGSCLRRSRRCARQRAGVYRATKSLCSGRLVTVCTPSTTPVSNCLPRC
jgi:hypothetical protein